MKTFISIISIAIMFVLPANSFGWGMTGHRVVGEVASKHLTKKAEKQVQELLGTQTLAEVSNWMDDIKSDDAYDSLRPWHYVTIPDGKHYGEVEHPEHGDAFQGIQFCIQHLKDKVSSPALKVDCLKMLVHLVGDLHQPLHVGNGNDRGGNKIKVEWFGDRSNLHRVWDSQIIDGKLYSYTELTAIINHPTAEQVSSWQSGTMEEWMAESVALREGIYDFDAEDRYWEYEYQYEHWDTIKLQLLKGGVRLAGILNEIFS